MSLPTDSTKKQLKRGKGVWKIRKNCQRGLWMVLIFEEVVQLFSLTMTLFHKKIHEYSWMVSTPGPMTSKAQHAQNFFLFFQKKKRVIFAWKTSNITNTNDTESRKFHACTNCILQFWTKKEPTMVPKPPEKVQWKNERTCPISHS